MIGTDQRAHALQRAALEAHQQAESLAAMARLLPTGPARSDLWRQAEALQQESERLATRSHLRDLQSQLLAGKGDA